jgi:sigma-B regulation protein RsbU (phosphoserine phosphatase)
MYTDGITEAQNTSEKLFSESRLEECLGELPSNDAAEAGKAVIDSVMAFQGAAPQFDDITLVALRHTAVVAAANTAVMPALVS